MIELKFEVSNEALITAEPVERTPRGVMVETVFEMPVFLIVNGVNVLGFPNGASLTVPVIGFVISLSSAVKKLASGHREKITIADGGCLFLEHMDGKVKFWTTTMDKNITAPYEDTLIAVQAFHEEVKRVLEARVPSIRNHPCWYLWFPDDQLGRTPNMRLRV